MNIPICVGTDAQTKKKIYIDATRHLSILGATGMGKSTLLESVFFDFVKQGYGGLFFDIHGDVYDRLALILPSSRHRDIIFYDPSLLAVPVFNPLSFKDPEELELAKAMCVSILKALSGSDELSRASSFGNETPYNLNADLDSVCEHVPDPTFVALYKWLTDKDYRDGLLDRSQNPFLSLFKKALERLSAKDQASKFAPGINKIAKLIRPTLLPLFNGEQTIDPLDIMNGQKIMICRLSKGRLGEEESMVIYSMLVSLFTIAALRRERQTDRPPFLIVADEAQNGVHGGKFGTLLAEARKYGISLVTAFQGSYQMPVMKDILTNSATQISFNVSGEDAQMLADNWKAKLNGGIYDLMPSDITSLPRYEFYMRTYEADAPIVRHAAAPKPLKVKREHADRLIRISLERYATPKEKTLDSIRRFLS